MTATTPKQTKVSNRRWLLPLGVFIVVFVLHAFYVRHAARQPVQGWADAGIVDDSLWGFRSYIQARDYFTGYSYALSLAFTVVALRRYREQRMCAARNLAIGGVSFSGFLAVAGCFLIGCCGSPMLGVYVSLFGASFLPFAKPFVAGLTTLMIGASSWWMHRFTQAQARTSEATDCATEGCDCGAAPTANMKR